MKTERIREILSAKKRGYADVSGAVINVVADINDVYYLGRKFNMKRQKDGSVMLTERKNGSSLQISEDRLVFIQKCGDATICRDGYDKLTIISILKNTHDGYFPHLMML